MTDGKRVMFQGRIIRLNLETVKLPNGEVAELEIVHHPGGAAVVALDPDNRVCLLRQFRHAVGGWLWELPAGKLDGGEEPIHCAQRELREEAGRAAHEWESLGRVVSSPGVFTEVVHLFLARGLVPVPAAAEAHEVFEIHWIDWQEALTMTARGEIEDAKTIAGLMRAAHHIGDGVDSHTSR